MSRSIASVSFVRFALTLGLTAAAAIGAVPACSSGEDFTSKNTGGTSNTGGSAGDASTTGGAGGSGGSGGSSGTSTGGVAGTGTGGVAGTGTGGVAGTGTGGVAGSASGGTGGNPGGKADGQACANKTECKSNYCVDDVCCESDCAGACRSCKVSGKEGLCTSYAPNTDPEGDCVGAGAPTDPCAGTCDGKSACDFPNASKSCGAQVCTNASTTTFACDDAGACKAEPKTCGAYQCSGASCLTNCSADTQCTNGYYCETPVCAQTKSLGAACTKDSACQSSHCSTGYCCSSTCGPNFNCKTGNCLCDVQTCAMGEACAVWYRDFDDDKFGDPGSTKLACAGQKPTGYVANNTDCYDNNANAKPGQTQFFTLHRGDGSFDYNCDKNQEKKYGVVNVSSCKVCGNPTLCPSPTVGPCTAGSFGCANLTFCPTVSFGFAVDVLCGTPGTGKECRQGSQLSGAPPYTLQCLSTASVVDAPNTTQACR